MSDVKKKLFIPRKIDERLVDWNKQQPVIDGVQINQYDLNTGNPTGRWGEGDYDAGDTIDLFEVFWDVFGDYYDYDDEQENIFNSMVKRIQDDLTDVLSESGPLYDNYYDLTIPLHSKVVWESFKVLYERDFPITESEDKKKLFIPRKLSGEDSRYSEWNKEQPIVDGERINQYDSEGRRQGLWVEYFDGNIASKKEYINGKVDGIDQSFYDNGQIHFDGHQKNNEFDGLWKMYYRTGQLKEIGNYENSYKQGVWKWYYPFENQLETIVKYIDGRPDGLAMEYFANGNIWKKMVYRLGKKIAYIIYTYDGDVNESMNWKDEYDNMVINEQIENKDDILKSWGNYYGSDDTANWELDSYESEVEDLIENGGNIYRVLFVDNLSEVNLKDMGNHWTTSRDNVIDVAEINQQYYGKNKQKVIVIEGYVEPNSITIEGVDVKGNPHEKEVNIKEGKGVKIKQIFEYVGRKFIPIDMNINEQMEDKDNILKSFEPQKELNPKVWDEDGKLKKKIKDTLVAIGQEFHKTLEVESPIDDIIFTGSLANYNWSQYSDVDLHVLMDFNKFDDKELIKKYFDAKKAVWNDNHDIKIKGYDVELYAQDKDEPHESTGIYSVMNDEWVKKPKPQDVKIDRETIKKKVKQFEGEYNRILKLYKEEKYEETRKALDKIKDKIKKYRKAGLDKGGEMATENLVFKTMRRSGLMEKIYDLGLETTDKEYTIETIDESKKLFIPRKLEGEGSRWSYWNKDQPVVDGVQINQYDLEGRKQGYWEENWSNTDKLNSKGNYIDDVKEGLWVFYHSDGSIWYEEEFKNGDSTKTIIYYYEDDELESKKVFVNNKYVKDLPLTESENKKKLFIPRKLSGEDSRYSKWNKEQPMVDGERINQYNVDTGKKEGIWVRYYDNGQLESKGKYKNGLRDGVWEYYYWNGTLERELYDNGDIVKNPQLSENINEGKLSDSIDDTLKNFKKNFGLDVGFLASFGAGINGLIKNMSSLIKEYTTQPLSKFEITNLAIAMIVVYLRKNKSLKDFKDEMLSIVAFTSLMPGYNDMVNSLLGNVDFMEAFMTIIKSVGVYSMLNHFKSK